MHTCIPYMFACDRCDRGLCLQLQVSVVKSSISRSTVDCNLEMLNVTGKYSTNQDELVCNSQEHL